MNKELIKDVFMELKRDKDRGLELLYNNYHTVLLGIAFKYTKSKELSEDIVQDVYLKLLHLDPSYFPKKAELSWLYVVTKNQAVTYIRKESKYVLTDQFDHLEDTSGFENLTDMTFDEMIEPLNETQKEVVSLKLYSGLTHKEIGKLLNKPIGTVQWIFNTSIKRLRKVLLTSVILSGILMISGVSRYGYLYYDLHYNSSPITPGIDIKAYYTDSLGITFIVVSIILFLLTVFFYKKTDVLPTKWLNKTSKY